MQSEKPKVLITGASGFIGSHLVAEALERGWEVYAGIRATSSRNALQDERIKFFPIDFEQQAKLDISLRQFAEDEGGFQFVIHNAGITKPNDPDEFYRGNALFTQYFADAVVDTQPGFRKFVYMSSIAALGPGDSDTFAPITELQPPNPITPYGRSKLQGEELLSGIVNLPHVCIRPSAVYGPRDEKFIGRLNKLFQKGIEVRLGDRDQRLSFVHVSDLARVTIDACNSEATGLTINISDGGNYTQEQLNRIIKDVTGVRTFAIRIPAKLLIGAGYVMFHLSSLSGRQVHLSHYKMRELTAKNWIIDIDLARRELDFQPRYDLAKGILQTLKGGV